ncbi:DUF5819 family protein [Streptomyces spiramyceticus]|uniref:DUF5819 family protein n=1 Tax=Streptomyces spiramyceticus TaxID=299717 RepID=UPI00237B8749|nr:DUF5819 family protein [Streptomyces spiramyceticus]
MTTGQDPGPAVGVTGVTETPEIMESPECQKSAESPSASEAADASDASDASDAPDASRRAGAQRGIAALSLPYQVVAAVALAVVGVLACVHLGMVFLHVAPSNTLSKQHGEAIDEWVYPEFEQNWKLFAPNPLQQNIAVQARAQVRTAEGQWETTGWIDLSAQDGDAIRGNLLPSHTDQNELRRGWDFYTASHDSTNKPNGLRGALSERYIRRIVLLRFAGQDMGGQVERIQVRSETTWVKAPSWSDEKTNNRPAHRVLPWWSVTAADLADGARAEGSEAVR